MGHSSYEYEPMCETSEEGERLFTRESIQMTSFDIGERILSLFGNQKLSNIVFRLRVNSRELSAVIRGEEMPSVEMLLGIQKVTGASIDWILSGSGNKFLRAEDPALRQPDNIVFPTQQRRQPARIPQLW